MGKNFVTAHLQSIEKTVLLTGNELEVLPSYDVTVTACETMTSCEVSTSNTFPVNSFSVVHC